MQRQIRNSKHEIRNESKIQGTNDRNAIAASRPVSNFRFWLSVFVSDFGFRIWNFPLWGVLVTLLTGLVTAQPANPHHQVLGGPWEVLVKVGMEGTGVRLPVSIADESKAQELRAEAPVMGTPIKVRLERYLPDLKWETTAIDDPNGGPVARLSLRGESLQQDIWLCARDLERQSISAHIGSVAIRELPAQTSVSALQDLTEPNVVGFLLVWLSGDADLPIGSLQKANQEIGGPGPLVVAARPGQTTALPGTPWKVSILRYVPHYSIDRQTKQVTNVSDKPENPAVEIRVEGDKQEYRQWLWSHFFSSPHRKQELPFRARFVDFHVAGAGSYMLVVRQGTQAHLLYLRDGKKHLEPAEPGKRYVFDDKRYSFAVDEIRPGAKIKVSWKNGSEMLLHPAVVATISQGQAAEQVVLEQGQPYHQKTNAGTLVVLYRKVPQ